MNGLMLCKCHIFNAWSLFLKKTHLRSIRNFNTNTKHKVTRVKFRYLHVRNHGIYVWNRFYFSSFSLKDHIWRNYRKGKQYNVITRHILGFSSYDQAEYFIYMFKWYKVDISLVFVWLKFVDDIVNSTTYLIKELRTFPFLKLIFMLLNFFKLVWTWQVYQKRWS